MTSARPAAWAGVVALICVALMRVTPVSAHPTTETVAGDAKLAPVMVMAVPPAVGPELGLTAATVGGGTTYVNSSPGFAALDCPLTLTMTSATPARCAGVVALICVALMTLTPVAADPPTVAVAPAAKPVPVIVMAVPPAGGADGGVTGGAGGGGKAEGNWLPGPLAA